MRVLVTGANGFLGSAMAGNLSENSHEVIKVNGAKGYQDEKNKIFSIDISDKTSVERLKQLENVDVVVHAAGLAHQFSNPSRDTFYDINVEGSGNICEISSTLGVKHFVNISSVSVYGTSVAPVSASLTEESECNPEGAYGWSKLEAEKACDEVFSGTKTKITHLRPATIIGERDPGNILRLITLIDKGRFVWVGKGENRKSLLYIDDLVGIISNLIEKTSEFNETFNVTSEPISMKEIVETIAERLQSKISPIGLPGGLASGIAKAGYKISGSKKLKKYSTTIDKWLAEDLFDGSMLFDTYGLKPETNIKEAIRREVDWFLETKK